MNWNLEPHDVQILLDLGIDPEVEEKSVDEEFDELFAHVREIRIRRGEWT